MQRFPIFLILIMLLATHVSAQTLSAKMGSNPKTEILSGFKRIKRAPKIRITTSANINGKMAESIIFEYAAPDRYRRLLKKVKEEDSVFEMESIEIAGQNFEEKGGKWVIENKPIVVLKDEFVSAVTPPFEDATKENVQFTGEEKLSGKTFFVYKFTVETDIGTTKGKVWLSTETALPEKMEIEVTFGSNKVNGSFVYEYDSRIVIEKPKI